MTVHNYKSRQVHETLNGVHPSSSFRDMRSAKSGPNLWQIWQVFWPHGQAHMGQMGKWPWQCTTRGLDNSTELRMENIRQAVTEIWVPQAWQLPDRPPARTVTTIPSSPFINSLWPSDVIWWQGSRSTLAQVMAWCRQATSHYLSNAD